MTHVACGILMEGYHVPDVACVLTDLEHEWHLASIPKDARGNTYVKWTYSTACECECDDEDSCDCYEYAEISEEEAKKLMYPDGKQSRLFPDLNLWKK